MTSEGAMRVGSLCSGYEGLSMGLRVVVGGDLAWVADNDPAAAKVLAARFPDVPNLGDITTTDWSRVTRVDWLTAGFPCQPASHAGKRKGMADERWLWDDVARAVAGVRPRHVLLENVPGLLSVDGGRAFERVVCDLAAMGYVGRYGVVRAADAGAPHGRARVFVVAYAHDSEPDEPESADGPADIRPAARWAESGARGRGGSAVADTDDRADDGERPRAEPRSRSAATAYADDRGSRVRRAGQDRRLEPVDGVGARQPAADTAGDTGRQRHGDVVPARHRRSGSNAAPADADSAGGETRSGRPGSGNARRLQPVEPGDTDWGVYGPAVRRWEAVLGRPAPRPTEPGRTGERLSPRFVEWLMGLPDGWVTDLLTRNQALKVLGNGCVPQQVALAVRLLLNAGQVAA